MPTNFETAFEPRPDVYAAWRELVAAVKTNMDERRYELATLAAARRLKSSYCSLAHGQVLQDTFGEDVISIVRGESLSDVDVAVMELAEQVASDATASDDRRQRLLDLGLSQQDVMDVVLAAAARCFFSKTLDGLAVHPDAAYARLPPEVREVLVVGRPIAT